MKQAPPSSAYGFSYHGITEALHPQSLFRVSRRARFNPIPWLRVDYFQRRTYFDYSDVTEIVIRCTVLRHIVAMRAYFGLRADADVLDEHAASIFRIEECRLRNMFI